MQDIPRSEHPRPQFVRQAWCNLNGTWTYEFDFGKSGMDRGLAQSTGFRDTITVPFCPESRLSGVAYTDFVEQLFYHRKITIPAEWSGCSVLLHFGGVDYECEAFINGQPVGLHYGGMASFTFDISKFVEAGKEYDLVVRAKDELRSNRQPYGKQCPDYKSRGCSYTRVTGIWQTVWMEALAPTGLAFCRITPELDAHAFSFQPRFLNASRDQQLRVTISGEGLPTVTSTVPAVTGLPFTVALGDQIRPWCPEDPFLYDIVFEVLDADGKVIDRVESYGGLRKIHIEGSQIYLNNKRIFLRFVLDQGYYPEGIWTAPSDEDLKRDIELSMAAGFNGARLHQKVFEERFHYWAARLGYLTWGETASWGLAFGRYMDPDSPVAWQSLACMQQEWREIVERDYNAPSIIAWTPLNETVPSFDHAGNPTNLACFHRVQTMIYDQTRALDATRPINETSGYYHSKTDLWTVHLYRKNREDLQAALHPENAPVSIKKGEQGYHGQPYINDEWGGFMFIPPERRTFADNSWGYHGIQIKNGDELCEFIREQAELMNLDPTLEGWCYTQLTDVEQEQNGVYNYDRTWKVDPAKLKAAFTCGLDKREA
ncbi:MAG: beta-glucuronidase [Lentisphaeria bacterium]|nr:beta-glucuronidase [Lentisphaeria bacterium]